MSEPDTPDDVVIPRAQYEAYKGAAYFVGLLYDLTGRQPPGGSWNVLLEKTMGALRDAGIHETEGGDS